MSVVKETTVVSKPGKDPNSTAGIVKDFANFGFAVHGLFHGRKRCVSAVHQPDEQFGLRMIGNHVGRWAASKPCQC